MVTYHKTLFSAPAGDPVYNPDLGKVVSAEPIITPKSCAVYDLSTQRKLEIYGRVNVRAVVLYHLGDVLWKADTVELPEGPFQGCYNIDSRRSIPGKATYVASEVKTHGH